MMNEKTKKDFQKVIKEIRTENGDKEYPKSMMTFVQMDKKQATVNCGGEWRQTERTKELSDIVMSDERFKSFLTRWEATAKVEIDNFGKFQIRIYY